MFHVGSGTAAAYYISVLLDRIETLSLCADRINPRTSAPLTFASDASATVTIMDNAIAYINKGWAALGAASIE